MNAFRDVQKAINPNLRLFGIALTMVQTNSNLGEAVAERARKHFGDRVFDTAIQRSVAIAEAPLEGAPIVVAKKPNKSNPGSKAYWELTSEVDARIARIVGE